MGRAGPSVRGSLSTTRPNRERARGGPRPGTQEENTDFWHETGEAGMMTVGYTENVTEKKYLVDAT